MNLLRDLWRDLRTAEGEARTGTLMFSGFLLFLAGVGVYVAVSIGRALLA
jgi:hypothetical protein